MPAALSNDLNAMGNSLTTEEIAPSKAIDGKVTAPWSKQHARAKARKAYDNARYRCGKPGSHESVKFLLPSFDVFIDAIGLPKNANESLDRIDAHGHYELANVRWASKSVQALNKKDGKSASTPSLTQYVAEADALHAAEIQREAIVKAWWTGLRYYNCRTAETEFKVHLAAAGLPQAIALNSFTGSHYRDALFGLGVFVLPSLCQPGAAIVMNGGPFREPPADGKTEAQNRLANERGVIRGLGLIPLSANVSSACIQQVAAPLTKGKFGICWCGNPAPGAMSRGWIEGTMLAAASKIRTKGYSAALLPAATAYALLPKAPWEDWLVGNLGVDCLFIPDFQVDAGVGWTTSPKQLSILATIVERRSDAGLKTYVGVQNLKKLGSGPRNTLLRYLHLFEFDGFAAPIRPSRNEVHAAAREALKVWNAKQEVHAAN